MKKRDWFYLVALPLVLTWLADRVTKLIAIEYVSSLEFHGYFGLVMHHNHGAMLGLFSNLPAVLRVVSLSTGGAFLIFIFFLIQYLLPQNIKALRVGLSILLGGILGNVADRIAWGYIVDFLVLGTPQKTSPVFNIADALQWIGYGLIFYSLIKHGKKIWPENDTRKLFIVNPKFQLKYSFMISFFGFAFSLIAGVYSYTYLRVTIIDLVGHQVPLEEKFLIPFLITFGIVCLTFIIFLFFVGLVLSHKAAGPLYAFELFLEDLSKGKIRSLRLRSGDEFMHLEELALKLTKRMETFMRENNQSLHLISEDALELEKKENDNQLDFQLDKSTKEEAS